MYLAHILYGSVVYAQGGIRLTARAAGSRGLECLYSCTVAGDGPMTPDITVTTNAVKASVGVGSVDVSVNSAVTEAALVAALKASAANALFKCELVGAGTAAVDDTVTRTGPLGGLLQELAAKTGIASWDDRELVTTDAPKGIIAPYKFEESRRSAESDGFDLLEGLIEIGVAIQDDGDLAHQYASLDRFRRVIFTTLTHFTHPNLSGINAIKWDFTNALKDEVAGTVYDKARLRVVFLPSFSWSEDPTDDEALGVLQAIKTGLWREPLDDALGHQGGELLDARITMTETEITVEPV